MITRLICDVRGTLIGNEGGHSGAACLQAVQDLAEAGCQVTLVSASPDPEPWCGLRVEDKGAWLTAERCAGAFWVDDDTAILRAVVRLGAIAVPAASLIDLSAALSRREVRQ